MAIIDKLKFGIHPGKDFFDYEFPTREFLIDSLIYKGDSVLLIGSPKAGKSLIAQSLCCSLTSATPFLDKFDVLHESCVLYVQLEGEGRDTQYRLNAMMKHTPINKDNFYIYYADCLSLESIKGRADFEISVDELKLKPDVIILDGFYLAFTGSLSDDKVIREVLKNLRKIKAKYNCTLIVVHHTHKAKFNQDGDLVCEGDNAVFGSQFLKAWPDHVIMLECQHNSDLRKLSCSTQRSGQIEKEIKLKLIQPDPLYFQTLDNIPSGTVKDNWKDKIMNYLNNTILGGAHAIDIQEFVGIPKSTFFFVIKELIETRNVYKDGKGKDTLYRSLHKQAIKESLCL